MIKDSRVRCNNINYPWEKGDEKIERKDLYVGDTPSVFFPYQVSWEYVNEIPHPFRANRIIDRKPSDVGILLTIKEISTQKIVFKESLLIPKDGDKFLMVAEPKKRLTFNTSIRLIGEGVDDDKDYSVKIELNDLVHQDIKEGKFTSNQMWLTFKLRRKHLLW